MFTLAWTDVAKQVYDELSKKAYTSLQNRKRDGKSKSSPIEGLFKQVYKTVELLADNPRHPGLHTHQYDSIPHPYKAGDKVFEAYAQNNTPATYRIFWCYGPEKKQVTIIAITQHP